MAENYLNSFNPNPTYGSQHEPLSGFNQQTDFKNFYFFELDEWIQEDPTFMLSDYSHYPYQTATEGANCTTTSCTFHVGGSSSSAQGNGMEKKEKCDKVIFRTISEQEVIDDGFKWRKYGRKMVKDSPYPRNYYKCKKQGCLVKKRIERDRDDERYVVTTYEGIHNHQGSQL